MTATEIQHDSDCAQHNEPAYPNGPCDCSARRKATTASASGDEAKRSETDVSGEGGR